MISAVFVGLIIKRPPFFSRGPPPFSYFFPYGPTVLRCPGHLKGRVSRIRAPKPDENPNKTLLGRQLCCSNVHVWQICSPKTCLCFKFWNNFCLETVFWQVWLVLLLISRSHLKKMVFANSIHQFGEQEKRIKKKAHSIPGLVGRRSSYQSTFPAVGPQGQS